MAGEGAPRKTENHTLGSSTSRLIQQAEKKSRSSPVLGAFYSATQKIKREQGHGMKGKTGEGHLARIESIGWNKDLLHREVFLQLAMVVVCYEMADYHGPSLANCSPLLLRLTLTVILPIVASDGGNESVTHGLMPISAGRESWHLDRITDDSVLIQRREASGKARHRPTTPCQISLVKLSIFQHDPALQNHDLVAHRSPITGTPKPDHRHAEARSQARRSPITGTPKPYHWLRFDPVTEAQRLCHVEAVNGSYSSSSRPTLCCESSHTSPAPNSSHASV